MKTRIKNDKTGKEEIKENGREKAGRGGRVDENSRAL